MNKHFSIIGLLTIATVLSYGQANTTLSNLTGPTAVNQHLIPNKDNLRNLGSAINSWKSLFLGSGIYLQDTLFLHTKGAYNTFIGMQAGKSTTTGTYNTGTGWYALAANTTGVQNAAFGTTALYSNTKGNNNTALGKSTLYHNDIGSLNTGLGFQALFYNTNGAENTASGAYAMFQNSTGSYNVAAGSHALADNTTGQQNTSVGYYSMFSNNSGNSNAAFGKSSMYYNYNGLANAAFGTQALFYNTSGNYNTASGSYGLFGNTKGDYNVGYGYRAGNNNNTGSFNVFIGSQAGMDNENGSNNVYIGYNSGGSAQLSNTVAIGANVKASQINTIILGTNQNVGIGTTDPKYRLSVNGTIQSKEVRVESGWSDYVFEKDYKLPSLEDVANYIEKNKHLPGINSAKDIQQNGLAVADMQTKMMAKIEELTLYIIKQEKAINNLQEQNYQLETKINSFVERNGGNHEKDNPTYPDYRNNIFFGL